MLTPLLDGAEVLQACISPSYYNGKQQLYTFTSTDAFIGQDWEKKVSLVQ